MTRTPKKKDDNNAEGTPLPHIERQDRVERKLPVLARLVSDAGDMAAYAMQFKEKLVDWHALGEQLLQHVREGEREAAEEDRAELQKAREESDWLLDQVRRDVKHAQDEIVGIWAPFPTVLNLDDLFAPEPAEPEKKEATLFD